MLTYLVILSLCAFVRANCPNGCEDNASCCEVDPNKYLCCPYLNGVCCVGSKHCCPQGSVCDAVGMTCKYSIGPQYPVRALYDPGAKKETGGVVQSEKAPFIICPDLMTFCSDKSTCCPMKDGQWGCCAYSQGVCCSDGDHCCPANNMCDVADGKCIPPKDSKPTELKKEVPEMSSFERLLRGEDPVEEKAPSSSRVIPATATSTKLGNHTCESGGSFTCPGDTTCCREKTGDWGCCPMQSAVCCSDGVHCCPHNMVCDVPNEQCINALSSSPLDRQMSVVDQREHTKIVPLTANAGDEQLCPDGKSRCPEMSTCCRLGDHKSYGCCPLEEAVCCSDGEHCCPKSYTCDIKSGSCVQGTHSDRVDSAGGPSAPSGPSGKKEAAVATTCPGGLVSCLSGTCCQTARGGYSCCPYKSGVCCADSNHCCPANSVCDSSTGGCLPQSSDAEKPRDLGSRSIATTVITSQGSKTVALCPGQDSYCQIGATCCQGEDNSWGCCPHENAVCCADKSHCCPAGTVCSPTQQGCISSSSVTDKVRVQASTRVSDLQLPTDSAEATTSSSTNCPDKQTVCDDHMPCCQLVRGQWGCCPLPNGVCCAKANHCCPMGTQCTEDGYCASTGTSGQLYTAPYLVPGRQQDGGRKETFFKFSNPVSFHYPLAKKASPATRDLMLLSNTYRRMKRFHHVICPSGVHRCAEEEQCCPSDRYAYTCAPKTSTCCSSILNTICPANKVCSTQGMVCNRA